MAIYKPDLFSVLKNLFIKYEVSQSIRIKKNTNLYKVPCKITILSNIKSELFVIHLLLKIQLAKFP